ncbi:MAG: metallopeptidase TldD-related protein [Hydrogenophilus sp.]
MNPGLPSLPHWQQQLQRVAEHAAERARHLGATAQTGVSERVGRSITVRHGEVETIEHHRERALSVTVYLDGRTGHAATSDLSPRAIEATVQAAVAIARHTEPDPAAGLPDPSWLADPSAAPDLGCYHPWSVTPETLIALTQRLEAAGTEQTGIVNSEGATCTTEVELSAIANTLGFSGVTAETVHSYSCVLLAQSDDGSLVRDGAWASRRAVDQLPDPEALGAEAATRALQRRNARRLPTGRYDVVFSPEVAPSLLSHFVAAASGGALYRRATFLLERFETQLFPEWFSIQEDPWLPQGFGSCPFDAEGVRVAPRLVIDQGRWVGRFLSSYTARKLGLTSTGNAGGAHNLLPTTTHDSLAALLASVDRGLLITELLGHGVNTVTGEYSRGAAGFWFENGTIAFPVHEITVSGMLPELFAGLIGVADDARPDRRFRLGSTAIAAVQIAGQ